MYFPSAHLVARHCTTSKLQEPLFSTALQGSQTVLQCSNQGRSIDAYDLAFREGEFTLRPLLKKSQCPVSLSGHLANDYGCSISHLGIKKTKVFGVWDCFQQHPLKGVVKHEWGSLLVHLDNFTFFRINTHQPLFFSHTSRLFKLLCNWRQLSCMLIVKYKTVSSANKWTMDLIYSGRSLMYMRNRQRSLTRQTLSQEDFSPSTLIYYNCITFDC